MSIANNEGEILADDDDGESIQPERRSSRSTFGRAASKFSDSQYSSLHAMIKAIYAQVTSEYSKSDATVATPQYNIKKGLTVFGKEGAEAVVSETKENLIGRDVIEPLQPKQVTRDIKKKALNYLMYLKRKRCGKVKGRGCADGRKQREYISKEESSSPTVSTQALITTCVIDAIQNRCVATVDINGFFSTKSAPRQRCWIRFEGAMADALIKLDPNTYRKCCFKMYGKRVIYAKAKKAIYGTLRGAILAYNKLVKHMTEDWGFKPNHYDHCTMNKIVNGKQLTVVWHVDDLKISHKEQAVVEAFIDDLNSVYGTKEEVSVNIGKVHDYLGMTIDYSKKNKVIITMFDYIKQILNEVDSSNKDFSGTALTPATANIYLETMI